MGINNLKIILNKYCKNICNKKNLNQYKNKILAIDSSIFIYKSLYCNNDILDGMTRIILSLLRNGIIPYFVFDGKPPDEKNILLENRKEKKNNLIDKKNKIESIIKLKENIEDNINNTNNTNDMNNTDDTNNKNNNELIEYINNIPINDKPNFETMHLDKLKTELTKVNKNIININHNHFILTYKLLDNFGIPYIIPNGEGETFCSKLYINKKVDGIISEDSDVLVNGGNIFIRGFNPNKNIVDEYNLNDILNELNITYEQFIDICILCGCDYTTKIKGIGPITAYKLILKHKNIENIIKNLNKKYVVPDNFDYIKARDLFINSFNDYDFNNLNIKLNKPDINKINELLTENLSILNKNYYNEINNNLLSYYNNIINYNSNNNLNNNKSIKKQSTMFDYIKTN